MSRSSIALCVLAALLTRPATASADVALLVYNASESTQLLLEDATGFIVIPDGAVQFGANGLATKLGNSTEDVCTAHKADAVLAIDFSGSKTVAGPVGCSESDPPVVAMATASQWKSELEDWPKDVKKRGAIWLGTVLNRAYASLGIHSCTQDKTLESVLPEARLAGLSAAARELTSFPLTFCEIGDQPVAPFVDLELLMTEIAPELHEALGTLQEGMPSLARRAARLVLANAFSKHATASHSFTSGSWRTTCTLTATPGDVASRKSLETPVAIECVANSARRRVTSTGGVSRMVETFRGTMTDLADLSTARDGLLVMGSAVESEMVFALVGSRARSQMRHGSGWKKLQAPSEIKVLQSPLSASKASSKRRETIAMRYVEDPTSEGCQFWFEDGTATPTISARTSESCDYEPDDSSRDVTSYKSTTCKCMDIVRDVKDGSWKISVP